MGMLLRRHHVDVNATTTKELSHNPEAEIIENNAPVETDGGNSYSRADIMGMKLDGLKKVAENIGIEGYESMSSSKLKVAITEKLGL